jgi:hypothetical protein
MNERHRELTRIQHVVAGCCLIAAPSAHAQAPQPSATSPFLTAQPRTVALASGSCPVVRSGDKVSLDWNPGFEHPGMVVGLRVFNLSFGRVGSNGVTVQQLPSLHLGGLAAGLPIADIGNGYFHIELSIPLRVAPGEYHLIGATAAAMRSPDYQGTESEMTNSPVREFYCITVVPLPKPLPSPSTEPGG